MAGPLSFANNAVPVIIAGAPRSGTTFLTTSLNRHPQVMITNELRSWSTFNDVRLRTEAASQRLPEHPLRDSFRNALLKALSDMFRDFYRQQVTKDNLGCPGESGNSVTREIRAYGDKNPGYADPHQAGCLSFIAEALPDAKFIHIHRDPRSCVASYKDIPVYADEIGRCIDVWRRHASSMATLADTLGPCQVLEISYEHYVTSRGDEIFRQIERHLGVDHATEPLSFLARERLAPIPYRAPTTPTGRLGQSTYAERLNTSEIRQVEEDCFDLMERYGYEISGPQI